MGKSHEKQKKKSKKSREKSYGKKLHIDWQYIEHLNKGTKITKKSSYVDSNGYLRWKSSDRLCHRDIAYYRIYKKSSFDLPFSHYEVHHKNHDELDNNIHNLEILLPEEHDLRHKKLNANRKEEHHGKGKKKEKNLLINGQKYIKITKADHKRKEKKKSIYISGKWRGWYPLKCLVVCDGYIYAPERIICGKKH